MNISLKDIPTYPNHSITLCLIAKNEELTLPILFKSLGNFKGEILVVDTGSTDQTATIARQFGAVVHEVGSIFNQKCLTKEDFEQIPRKFKSKIHDLKENDNFFDFGEARNYAIRLCRNEIIVMPDCDEFFVNINWDLIQYLFEKTGTKAITSNLIYFSDYILTKLCIFDRRVYQYKHIIHEVCVKINDDKKINPTENLKLPEQIILLRQGQQDKERNYIRQLLYSYLRYPEDIRYMFYLAREFSYNCSTRDHPNDNYLDSIQLLTQLIPKLDKLDKIELNECGVSLFEIYYLMIFNLMHLNRYQEALKYSFDALNKVGPRHEFFIQISSIYIGMNAFENSIIYSLSALNVIKTIDPKKQSIQMVDSYETTPYVNLYNAYYSLDRYDDALKIYENIKCHLPTNISKAFIYLFENNNENLIIAKKLISFLNKNDKIQAEITENIDFRQKTIVIGACESQKQIVFFPETIILNTSRLNREYRPYYMNLLKRFIVWDADKDNVSNLKANNCRVRFISL